LFSTDILGLKPVGFGGVLLSTPLHASSNFTVSVQLANKRGLKKMKRVCLPAAQLRPLHYSDIQQSRHNIVYELVILMQ
jgi:hypothetical protein